MKLQTKYFGEIDYETADILRFPSGLFGFESEHEFLLLPFADSAGTLLCLQSVTTPRLAFVVVDPFSLSPGYTPELQPGELAELGVEDSGALSYYTLCVVKKPVSESTVNLKCPVVIHPDTRVARQVILDGDVYHMRHLLSEFNRKDGDGLC